ncbi:MAG: hypothetical protein ACRCZ9_05330 [Fusobacteriaceae bacterium]
MKKSLYLLAALSLIGSNVFAKEVVAPVTESSKEVIVEPVVVIEEVAAPAWSFAGRAYVETEDFDNQSPIINGDDEDGTFIGTGISATKGKLTLDLNVEKRLGGDLGTNSNAEWDAVRADWKVRYQLFEKQAFHLKYRSENKVVDSDRAPVWMKSTRRNRIELGTDFNHFNGLFAGWFVVGHDEDKKDGVNTDGNYWEGDFGPTFKITENLSLNPTIYTTGERYDGGDMDETQLRIMMPYKATEKLTIMPRVRFTLDRENKNEVGDKTWSYKAGERVRYELMANYVINEQFSTFLGAAYEQADRDFETGEKKDIDLIWTYVGLNYKFN